ncbi:MAG: cyclic-di-AMP receptor [Tissierellia bacterium]|nr:cyclic-di-AMP receptor [Tissierellia bacterium]
MKLVIAIVQDQDSQILVDEVTKNDFRVTKLATSGGFLKSGNTTLLMGVEEDRLQELLSIIENNCKSREVATSLLTVTMPGDSYVPYPINVKVGGATIFIVDVEEFIQF